MKCRLIAGIALCAGFAWSGLSMAQSCDAYFKFDGDLSDASGNGYDGTMIGKDGATGNVSFGDGLVSQALHLDGSSAMRAFLDPNFESSPQVTIAAWVRMDAHEDKDVRYLFSTGSR